jgi:CheY-like chemotaxis protein
VNTPPSRHVAGYRGPRKRVLIVDDSAFDRRFLEDVLAPLGFDVVAAVSGAEALLMTAQTAPDLILLDIDMPGMNGWEVARLLRSQQLSEAPILIVSANAFEVDLHNNVGVEREDFIVKPLRIDDLLTRMRLKLGIEWIDHGVQEPAVEALSNRQAISPANLAILRQLGDLGYVRGILEKLDEIDRLDADCASATRTLRYHVQRFDLPGYARVLDNMTES